MICTTEAKGLAVIIVHPLWAIDHPGRWSRGIRSPSKGSPHILVAEGNSLEKYAGESSQQENSRF